MAKVMAIVEGELMIDYAYPCMMAEKALKELHSETKLALNAITDMQAKSLK